MRFEPMRRQRYSRRTPLLMTLLVLCLAGSACVTTTARTFPVPSRPAFVPPTPPQLTLVQTRPDPDWGLVVCVEVEEMRQLYNYIVILESELEALEVQCDAHYQVLEATIDACQGAQ